MNKLDTIYKIFQFHSLHDNHRTIDELLTEEEQEYMNKCLQKEKEYKLIQFSGEKLKRRKDIKEFWKTVHFLCTNKCCFLDCEELNTEEKIKALERLEIEYRKVQSYFTYRFGLCAMINRMLEGHKISGSEYIFLHKVIRYELLCRKLTNHRSEIWLFDSTETQKRYDFLSNVISIYKEGKEYLEV